MLKLIRIFVMAAFTIDEHDGANVLEAIDLVKKGSSITEE